jgi:hypothetical protein
MRDAGCREQGNDRVVDFFPAPCIPHPASSARSLTSETTNQAPMLQRQRTPTGTMPVGPPCHGGCVGSTPAGRYCLRTWESLAFPVAAATDRWFESSRPDSVLRWGPCWYGQAPVKRTDTGSIPVTAAVTVAFSCKPPAVSNGI